MVSGALVVVILPVSRGKSLHLHVNRVNVTRLYTVRKTYLID